jgi:uncharacterized membrane protein
MRPEDIICPSCGHELSMWHAPEPSRGERYAMRLAQRVASWGFVLAVLLLIAAWVAWSVAARPFQPYPVIIFAVISAVLATVASLQGPLILLTQRRAAERDRARDEEALRVAVNAEADLHRVEAKLDALAILLGGADGAPAPG